MNLFPVVDNYLNSIKHHLLAIKYSYNIPFSAYFCYFYYLWNDQALNLVSNLSPLANIIQIEIYHTQKHLSKVFTKIKIFGAVFCLLGRNHNLLRVLYNSIQLSVEVNIDNTRWRHRWSLYGKIDICYLVSSFTGKNKYFFNLSSVCTRRLLN